jgi:hypothetical protein
MVRYKTILNRRSFPSRKTLVEQQGFSPPKKQRGAVRTAEQGRRMAHAADCAADSQVSAQTGNRASTAARNGASRSGTRRHMNIQSSRLATVPQRAGLPPFSARQFLGCVCSGLPQPRLPQPGCSRLSFAGMGMACLLHRNRDTCLRRDPSGAHRNRNRLSRRDSLRHHCVHLQHSRNLVRR